MADVMPNYQLEKKKLSKQKAAMRLNIESQELEMMEMEDRKVKYTENIAASLKAIEDLEKRIAGLEKAHPSS